MTAQELLLQLQSVAATYKQDSASFFSDKYRYDPTYCDRALFCSGKAEAFATAAAWLESEILEGNIS